MSRRICLVFVASLALAGCDMANKEEAQHDDATNPFYKSAQQDLDNNNPSAAATDYENALAADSKLAGAHYELGRIYGDKLNDPVASIYHFRRYLELDPSSVKADQVKALIDKQSQAFAASLPNSPAQSADDYAKLQSDNASLKKQVDDEAHTIAQLQDKLTRAGKHHANLANPAVAAAPPAAPVPPAVSPDPASGPAADPGAPNVVANSAVTNAAAGGAPLRALPVDTNAPDLSATAPSVPAGPSKTYKVVAGDSLWKISHKMYPGDTKNGVEKIQDANKDTMPPGKPLKIGQVLIIPE